MQTNKLLRGISNSAIADIDNAIAGRPQNAVTYASRGFVRLLQGKAAEAARDFEYCLTLDPSLKPLIEQLLGYVENVRFLA
jgi:hypothetical protein